ncbi:hypothetical protein DPMN_187097 [Dreissena polymorpha]|uniref:N-acetyl-beta-glucosaminidase n=1 Tax=Dreissena polymorpha TaxID=45954 RepID=A0A9D4DRG9_DREPO|nr:hypothetical protein DPMN_187097 [Dreissena polymorpha]
MYFYSMFLLFPGVFPGFHHNDLDTVNFRITMVQGDLYSLAPMAGFQPISPGKSVEFNISASLWSVARTDFMPRWYVTSDDVKIKPRIVKCTASEDLDFVQPFEDVLQRKRWKGDQYEPFTPEVSMEKLRFIPENVVGNIELQLRTEMLRN